MAIPDGENGLNQSNQPESSSAGPRPKKRTLLAWHRSQLANERTFLAWCRTSISLLAFGFVIEKLDLFLQLLKYQQGTQPAACSSIPMRCLSYLSFGLAGTVIIVAGLRFLRVRRHMNTGEASFSILPDLLVIVSVAVIVALAILLAFPTI